MIELSKSGSGAFMFSADALEAGDFDTPIAARGTEAFDAKFGEINVSCGRLLSVFSLDGGVVSVDAVKVEPGKAGRLLVADTAGLSLGGLDVRGGTIETVLPAGFAAGGTAIVAERAYGGGQALGGLFRQLRFARGLLHAAGDDCGRHRCGIGI
ncbi:MAG: hypothetical protein LBQ12_10535 [Deltaproteobacteria bacterium]|nr:hypothetical protein [Deltaproteobacteria bacterium]